jgi:sterol desaturase/sphingolipid hydroxylase (fatty acid hydroxylase superfamily)
MDDTKFGSRNERGEWKPAAKIAYAPVLDWPIRPIKTARWLLSADGFFLPWNLGFGIIAFVVWRYLTPSTETTATLEPYWIAYLLLRNALIVLAFYGAWHLRLYIQRAQGNAFKYDARWPTRDKGAFLFRNQNIDNLIWTFASGVPIWTMFEVGMLWAYSNGYMPKVSWSAHPVYCTLLLLATPFWADLHFYAIHRLIHWPPLYKYVHSVHHNNINPGPFSGLAMHPVEHLLYFSSALLYLIVPSNSLHFLAQLLLKALGPAQTHAGFDKLIIGQDATIDTHGYAHYLHHRYFECNYADTLIPLDKWFGTFHDGSPEKQAEMKQRLVARATRWSKGL